MTNLESKFLDGPCVGYCSSSDDDNDADFKVVNDADDHEANFARHLGATANTGPKGVIEDFKQHREDAAIDRKRRDNALLVEAKRGLLEIEKGDKEESSDDEDILQSLRRRRLSELRKEARGKIVEIQDQDQFMKLTENQESGLIGLLIYEPNREDCAVVSKLCKILAAEYPSVKFARVTSTILKMSDGFKSIGVPALQFYYRGELVKTFVQLSTSIGIEANVQRLKKFLRTNRINLTRNTVASDSDCSSNDDI